MTFQSKIFSKKISTMHDKYEKKSNKIRTVPNKRSVLFRHKTLKIFINNYFSATIYLMLVSLYCTENKAVKI